MLFKNFIDDLGVRLKVETPNDPVVRNMLGRKINESYKEVSLAHDWEFLKRTSELITIPNFTTGTANITNNSRTVQINTGSVTSQMLGRYFNPGGGTEKSTNWYRIIAVDTTLNQLTLQLPVIESTQSGISYTIWKRFYYLHSEVRKLTQFLKWFDDGKLNLKSNQFIVDNALNISTVGVVNDVSLYGVDPFTSVYNTGTVSLTQDSQSVIGVGTLWLDNIEPGDLFILSGVEYRVKRVTSDTTLILFQNSLSTSSTVGYSIYKDNPLGIQFYPESDKQYLIPYSYFKHVWGMINENNDRPELPEVFDQAILDGAESARLRETNDPKWTTKFQEYTSRVQELKKKMGHLSTPRYRQFSPFVPTRTGY